MKFEEALKLMREGKKMINANETKGTYFYFDRHGRFCFSHIVENERADCYVNYIFFEEILDETWHEYKEPILDDVEKKYLEAVLKPFKKRTDYVIKRVCSGGEYIFIFVNGNRDSFSFPCFKPNTMYTGMELNKQYTLEELGLFEGE